MSYDNEIKLIRTTATLSTAYQEGKDRQDSTNDHHPPVCSASCLCLHFRFFPRRILLEFFVL